MYFADPIVLDLFAAAHYVVWINLPVVFSSCAVAFCGTLCAAEREENVSDL